MSSSEICIQTFRTIQLTSVKTPTGTCAFNGGENVVDRSSVSEGVFPSA